MFFKWFDARQATQFGTSMAEFLAKRIPPESIPAEDKKPLRRAAEVISKVHTQARRFRSENQLNVFKKAKLANAFQWKLFELGYDKRIVAELTKELVRHL